MKHDATLEHPILGFLQFDPKLDWWSGRARWGGEEVDLYVSIEGPITDEQADAAATVLRALDCSAMKRFACDELRDLHNDEWRDGTPIVDAVDFVARLRAEAVTIYWDGSCEVCFRDGELFGDHLVVVSIAADGMPIEADLGG